MEERVSHTICERENDLIAFLYGEVDEREARDFEHHLQSCSECKKELSSFRELRGAVGAWRQESLSGVPAYSVQSNAVSAGLINVKARKPSAVAAIRAFFELSPLWTKGALALAAVLFCVVSIFAVIRFLEKPQANSAANGKVYSEQELKTKVEQGVLARLEELEAGKETPAPLVAKIKTQQDIPKGTQSVASRASDQPNTQRRPLTRSEREQLAADLRLISSKDETDLDLVSDKINN